MLAISLKKDRISQMTNKKLHNISLIDINLIYYISMCFALCSVFLIKLKAFIHFRTDKNTFLNIYHNQM